MNHKPDLIDAASDYTEAFTQQSIDNVLRNGGETVLPFKGTCYNCLETVKKPHRFCDEYCIEDWEFRKEARKRNGK